MLTYRFDLLYHFNLSLKGISYRNLLRLIQRTLSFPIDLTMRPFTNKQINLNLEGAMEMDFEFYTDYSGTSKRIRLIT